MDAKLSILVPICNVERYLSQCLESLINQTLKNIEIICINDGSKDDSLKIITDFAKKDDRIIIIDKPNSGYGDSMNRGLKAAKGEYIGIVESDDFIEENMFYELYCLAKKYNTDITRGEFFLYWQDKGDLYRSEKHFFNYNKVFCLESCQEYLRLPPAIWTAIYRRDFLDKYDIRFLATPGAAYQDTSFFIKTAFSAKSIYVTNSVFLHYRQDNANSSVKDTSLDKAMCLDKEYAECDDFIEQWKGVSEESYKEYNSKRLTAMLWNLERISTSDAVKYSFFIKGLMMSIINSGIYHKNLFSKMDFCIINSVVKSEELRLRMLLSLRKWRRTYYAK